MCWKANFKSNACNLVRQNCFFLQFWPSASQFKLYTFPHTKPEGRWFFGCWFQSNRSWVVAPDVVVNMKTQDKTHGYVVNCQLHLQFYWAVLTNESGEKKNNWEDTSHINCFRGVGHDVIKILNFSTIQCKFNRWLKIPSTCSDAVT